MRQLLAFIFGLLVNTIAFAATDFDQFADRMHDVYQFDRNEIKALVEGTQPLEDVLKMYARPATNAPFDMFEAWFINERRIDNGVAFWAEHRESLERAQREYGVSIPVLVALIGIETNYGTNIGKFKVVESLITLGFYGTRRQEYFRSELEQFLVAARDLNWNKDEIVGSFAGAIGIPQFMPSNIKLYAVDFDGDGVVNIVTNKDDAIGSVANYLHKMGWKKNQPVATKVKGRGRNVMVLRTLPGPNATFWRREHNYAMIKRYNPSDNYAMTIFILSEKIKQRYNSK